MRERIACFVLSGGVGSRLWPLSREDNPKQFHDLAGNGSMLSKTVRRLKAREEGETPVFVIASERHAALVRDDLAGLDIDGAIFEPTGRNTAAAVAVAAIEALSLYGNDLVLVVPSDHEISTDHLFWATIERGVPAALAGRLVVFGIRPVHPETGYGYIETAASAEEDVADVARFVEKPDLQRAEAYLAAGNFYWNAGIFLFRAGTMRDAFLRLRPDIWNGVEAAFREANREVSGLYLPLAPYEMVPSTSIDYAVVERLDDIAMVRASFRWNDLGSWQSLLDVGPSDGDGNVIVGDVADVRFGATVVFASSTAVITSSPLTATTPFPGSSPVTNTLTAVTVSVTDTNGNSLPTGSTIALSAIDDGFVVPGTPAGTNASCSVTSTTSFTIPNTVGAFSMPVILKACSAGDQLKVRVTSPAGRVTEAIFTVLAPVAPPP